MLSRRLIAGYRRVCDGISRDAGVSLIRRAPRCLGFSLATTVA